MMDLIQQAPIDFTNLLNMTTVCIDNSYVRKSVSMSQRIKIDKVPCILIVFPDGGVEKYDGSNAFHWIENIIQKHAPPQLPPQPTQSQPTQPQPTQQPQQQQQQSTQQPKIERTSVDDLGSEDEQLPPHGTPNRPPRPIRSDKGNYETQGDFGSVEDDNRNVTSGVKSTLDSMKSSKGSLMETAMAMRKGREQQDSTMKRNSH